MAQDPSKLSPNVVADPKREDEIRRRPTYSMNSAAGKTAMIWKIGSERKRS